MRGPGEIWNHGDGLNRTALLLILAIAVPFVLGAGAPAALRGMTQVPSVVLEPLPAPVDAGISPIGATAPARQWTTLIASERVGTRAVPLRPAPLSQRHTLHEHPPATSERVIPPPTLRPSDPGWVARRLEIPALGVDVSVAWAASAADEDFPPHAGAYILRSSAQPGRGTNSYLFAHAMPDLFKPLWVAEPGQQVIVTMSDGQQLAYRVTAVVRDIPCPDPSAHKPAWLPPVLANATECDLSWTLPTASERLTMQTSQGFNRNYGEMVVIAEPDW